MATKRKRSRTRRKRMASAALLSTSPRRRRRSTALTTSPRRRKRARGLSELNLVKGKMGKIFNPMLEGSAGGFASQGSSKLIPGSIFTDNPSLAPHEKLIKRGVGYLLSGIAAHLGYPLVAAGIAGGTTVLLMQDQAILQEGPSGSFSGRRLTATRYANPGLLSDRRLLSESLYAPYQPLYERASDEFTY